MSIKNIFHTTFLITFLGILFSTTQVQAEVIRNFDTTITVAPNGLINVVEHIIYNTEGLQKHGIYRDITAVSARGEKITLSDIHVVDEQGVAYQFQKEKNGDDIRLKIGDPDRTFSGEKTYVVSYAATNALSFQENFDEVYWNATGNAWPFRIEHASAVVVLPSAATVLQSACYYGAKGSITPCTIAPNMTSFTSPRVLAEGEGLTVAVGFPKNIVHEYMPTLKDKIVDALRTFWPILIPLLILTYKWREWYQKGRDAKGTGVIVAQYEIPDGLTPLESAIILKQKSTAVDMIAEILHLATKGYISITQDIEKKFFVKTTTHTLVLLKLPAVDLPDFDQVLLRQLFHSENNTAQLLIGDTVVLSPSQNLLIVQPEIEKMIKTRVVDAGYYTADFAPKTPSSIGISRTSVLYFLLAVFLVYLRQFLGTSSSLEGILLGGGVMLSALIIGFFSTILPAKTAKGIDTKEHLLGLKEYIAVAEKERIAFHNDPAKNAAIFEQLLPYAIMFGLEKKWANAFKDITIAQPAWYRSGNDPFVASVFASQFSRSFAASVYPAGSSTSGIGSTGGGFSGGGGGGGGGGSW